METAVFYAVALLLLIASALRSREKTGAALRKSLKAIENLLPQLLVVILLVAALLALIRPETISRVLGESSGVAGTVAAALIGSVTLIPGFVAFPAAAELLSNGAGVMQVAAFISALMMVGVVTLPLEIDYFGRRAALLRNGIGFIFVFFSAAAVAWGVSL